MRRILIAPDKFKGTLSAPQVCDAIGAAITTTNPDWSIEKIPMADGGEGTCELLVSASGGKFISAKARDPLFREIETQYGLSPDGQTAFIEMANASGLSLLKTSERNPLLTSTIGTGDIIVHALKKGVRKFIIGCGGSATNDGGIGMASALGIFFLDEEGTPLLPVGMNLSKIKTIDTSKAMKEISTCQFMLITDVDNPLCGKEGASHTFAKQKGATPLQIEKLDRGLSHFSKILEAQFGKGVTNFAGAGAAGGFPVSAKIFLNAELNLGIDFIMDYVGMEEKIKQADLVISGEGKLDKQSVRGKTVSGISRFCKKHNKKLWVVCGSSDLSIEETRQMGIERVMTANSDASNAWQIVFETVRSRLS
jgi:glycerate 2-kinase